jgi:hypothetical protein
MALDLTGLTAYTSENSTELISAAVLKGSTIDRISVQAGIKSAEKINYLAIDNTFQAGACGFNAVGNVDLTQRTIAVDKVKQNAAVCVDDLEAYYTQLMMKAGSYNEDMPFEQKYAELVVEGTQTYLENLVWRGDKDNGSLPADLQLANGLLKAIDGESSVVSATTTTLVTAANIIARVDEMIDLIPVDALQSDDLSLFMPLAHYRMYCRAMRNANLFHYTADEKDDFAIVVAGTNVTVRGTKGLNGVSAGDTRWILAEDSNLWMGTDLLNDAENFSIAYSVDNDEVRTIQKFKFGTQISFPERIVELTTAS